MVARSYCPGAETLTIEEGGVGRGVSRSKRLEAGKGRVNGVGGVVRSLSL